MDEPEFIEQLKAGSSAAFSELVKRHRNRVINTCYRFVLQKEEAEDLAQQVFIEVYESIPTFRGDSSLSTWIYRIAVSKCLDEIKRNKRKKRFSSIALRLHLDDVAHWLEGGRPADANLIRNETNRELLDALNTLPDNQRVAFTLSKIEGYGNNEIADIMDISVMAVESLVYRAKKKLGDTLREILQKK